MNANEGIRRIARGIRFIGEAYAALCSILLVYALFADVSDRLTAIAITIGTGVLMYGVFWGISWIVLGFAQTKA